MLGKLVFDWAFAEIPGLSSVQFRRLAMVLGRVLRAAAGLDMLCHRRMHLRSLLGMRLIVWKYRSVEESALGAHLQLLVQVMAAGALGNSSEDAQAACLRFLTSCPESIWRRWLAEPGAEQVLSDLLTSMLPARWGVPETNPNPGTAEMYADYWLILSRATRLALEVPQLRDLTSSPELLVALVRFLPHCVSNLDGWDLVEDDLEDIMHIDPSPGLEALCLLLKSSPEAAQRGRDLGLLQSLAEWLNRWMRSSGRSCA